MTYLTYPSRTVLSPITSPSPSPPPSPPPLSRSSSSPSSALATIAFALLLCLLSLHVSPVHCAHVPALAASRTTQRRHQSLHRTQRQQHQQQQRRPISRSGDGDGSVDGGGVSVKTDANFPVEIKLIDEATQTPIQRPIGVVAGLDTTMIVATVTGQIFLADVKTGTGKLLNVGGDDQSFGGVCLDSRNEGTIYATGRDSGAVFAFNRRGELLVRYQITPPRSTATTSAPSTTAATIDNSDSSSSSGNTTSSSSSDNKNNKNNNNASYMPYLTGCIQTRFQLMIADSLNAKIYYLPLADEGPMRGRPPIPSKTTFQGFEVNYTKDWIQLPGPGFNAYGVEWSQKFNETVFVVNSKTGHIYTTDATRNRVEGAMTRVEVIGNRTTFPGALGILYDSTNEHVMYLSMPHLNAIAVLEFSFTDPNKAKFIRLLTNPLLDGPIAIGEFGNHIYPISGQFQNPGPVYKLVRMSRHRQLLNSDDEEFTSTYDETNKPPEQDVVVTPPNKVSSTLQAKPPQTGTKAPAPLSDPKYTPVSTASPTPSNTATPSSTPPPGGNGDNNNVNNGGNNNAEPNVSVTPTPIPPATQPPQPASPSSAASGQASSSSGPPSTFGDAAASPTGNGIVPGRKECFPARAMVELRGGRRARMDELEIGDEVLTESAGSSGGQEEETAKKFSGIFLFSHRDTTVVRMFVQLTTETTNTCTTTKRAQTNRRQTLRRTRSSTNATYSCSSTPSTETATATRISAIGTQPNTNSIGGDSGAGTAASRTIEEDDVYGGGRERGDESQQACDALGRTVESHVLELTEGHLLQVNDSLRAAGSVRVGEWLRLADGRKTRVVRLRRVRRRGLFNPQTVSGDLVVNGIRVSAYTTGVRPRAACAMLSPLRAVFSWRRAHALLRTVSSALAGGDPIGLWLPSLV